MVMLPPSLWGPVLLAPEAAADAPPAAFAAADDPVISLPVPLLALQLAKATANPSELKRPKCVLIDYGLRCPQRAVAVSECRAGRRQ